MLVKSYQNGQGRGGRDQTGQKGDHHPGRYSPQSVGYKEQLTLSSQRPFPQAAPMERKKKKMLNKKYFKTIRSKFNKKLFLNRTKSKLI